MMHTHLNIGAQKKTVLGPKQEDINKLMTAPIVCNATLQ